MQLKSLPLKSSNMIGILKPDRKKLPRESKAVYSLTYCSHCKACQDEHGSAFTLFISHEISQLLIPLLKYIPCELEKVKCHFFLNLKSCQIIRHEIFERASNVSLLLVWLKIEDAINDKEMNRYRILHYLLKNRISHLSKILPSSLIKDMETYKKKISTNNNPEYLSQSTNILAKSLFRYIIDCIDIDILIKEEFIEIAGLYGNIITETDYLLDYEKDHINDIKQYEKIENSLFNTLYSTKEKVEKLCLEKHANNYYKTCFFMSIKAINEKIEKTKPNSSLV